MVLACAEGLGNQAVAKKLRCSKGMAGNRRSRFLEARLEGLYDEPRPGAPRKVGDAEVERVVIQTLESTPTGKPTGPRAAWVSSPEVARLESRSSRDWPDRRAA